MLVVLIPPNFYRKGNCSLVLDSSKATGMVINMMNEINSRLIKELFEEKSVLQEAELYETFYSLIWPCEHNYIEFLKAEDSSVKLSFAKKIYNYERAEGEIFLPEFTINTLIKVQQTHVASHKGEYIAQDHVIHSVNLYILGIYLFFNVPVFQRSLVPALADEYAYTLSADYEFMDFLKKWKTFALYHDVGYVFETLASNTEKTELNYVYPRYNQLYSFFLHDCVCRSVARTILSTYLFSKSTHPFDCKLLNLHSGDWKTITGKVIKETEIREKLNSFQGYCQIKNVFSPFGLQHVLPFIKSSPLLILVKDEASNLAAIILCEGDSEPTIYESSNKLNRRTLQLISKHIPIRPHNLRCYYFSEKPSQSVEKMYKDSEYSAFGPEVLEFPVYLKRALFTKLALITDDNSIDHIYNELFGWLKTYFNENSTPIEATELINRKMDQYLKHVLSSSVTRLTQEYLSENKLCATNLDSAIISISEIIKKINSTVIANDSASLYNKWEGIAEPIINYFNYLFENCLPQTAQKNGRTLFTYDADGRLEINGFGKDDIFSEKIYDALFSLARELKIDFEKMIHYKPNYSSFDHGVVSAAILFEIAVFRCNLLQDEIMEKLTPIQVAWKDFEDTKLSDRELQKYADMIFSILIHNIYTKKVRPEYGLDYLQDISRNPFSYFGAVADLLQKWSRPKQIDFSKLDLPDEHFLSGNYDIKVTNGVIHVVYSAYTSGLMQEELNKAEDYLPGIKELVRVEEKTITAQNPSLS